MALEITVLGWSVVLLLIQIGLQSSLTARDNGSSYAAGNHETDPTLSPLARRAANALKNLLETYVAFVGLALALAVTQKTGSIAATGAVLWIAARVAYLAIYLLGIRGIRTIAWLASILGLLMMLYRLLLG